MSKLPFLSRAFFARITNPLARAALRVGLTPDAVTVIGTTASVAGALVLFPMGKLFAGGCVVWFFVLFDMLDGAMARERGEEPGLVQCWTPPVTASATARCSAGCCGGLRFTCTTAC